GPDSPRLVDAAEPVESCAFSPDGHELAARHPDGSIALYDLARGKRKCVESDRAARLMAFAPDGRRLALSGHVEEAAVQVVDLDSGRVVRKLWHPDDAQAVAWSGDGRLLAVGGDDLLVHVWDTAEWKEQATLAGHHKEICEVAFSPDGTLLASS